MFAPIIRHGILIAVATLIVSLLGIVAAFRIPVQMIPDLDVRTISIRTSWPGATPQDVEKEILVEQEEYLRNLPGLSRINSQASSGSASVQLEFPFGTDINNTLIRVNNALNQVPAYPETAREPVVYATSFSANAFMFYRVAPLEGNPRGIDMNLQRDAVLDNMRPLLTRVPGVSDIGVYGGAERQVQILVDPARLAQRQLTMSEIRSAVRARNRDRSGGEVESGKRRYLLRTVGRFDNLQDLQQLIISRRGEPVIRLQDVARVQLDHYEKNDAARVDGKPVLFITVRREAGSNVIDIKRAIEPMVERVNREVLNPRGMELLHMADDVVYVEASLANVWQNLILGAIFSTLVMYFFLRSFPATFAGVIGVPLCTIAAFLGLLIADRTINVISLAGIAFALGMTLDNSIVVLESIRLERRKGKDAFASALAGVQQVWPAILASTLTTVLVFLPVAFVEEEAGQLYSDIAVAVSAAILASMLVAITVVPTVAARLSLAAADGSGRTLPHLRQRIVGFIAYLLANRRRQIATVVSIVLASTLCIVFLTPPAEYLPEGEEPKVFAAMNAPPGYNFPAMNAVALEIEEYFLPFVNDDPARFDRGEVSVPAMRYLNLHTSTERMRIITEPVDSAHIDALMQALVKRYREVPGMRSFAARGSIITSNDGGTRSINVDIAGPRLSVIYEVAQKIYRQSSEVFGNPRINSAPSSLSLAQPLIEVHPRWDRAAELGVDANELGFAVAALTDGSFVDEFFLADEKIDIYLYSDAGQQSNLETLPDLPVYTPSGATVPLSSLADLVETMDTSSFRRVNGRRTVTLSIIPPPEIALETGVAMLGESVVEKLRQQGDIPAEVSITLSGAADQLDKTRDALFSNYLIALAVVYLLLVAIFRHWAYPLLIMTAIPLGVAGGIAGLALVNAVGGLTPLLGLAPFNQPFDMISMLGFLILMGTVVNNPILIVHRAIANVGAGIVAQEAVREAVEARLRPIAMSTITTICGLAPLVLIPGAGTELYRGVGVIVLFGIAGAAVVSLTLLPIMTLWVLERGETLPLSAD